MTDTLRAAAQAVVDRWDTPLWKDVPATAEYIGRLRASLAASAGSEPLTDSYVQMVPDKCDRIVWRNHYYHLPLNSATHPSPPEGMVAVPKEFIRAFSDTAHNYQLSVEPPDHFSGTEGDAFRAAYARCGVELLRLRGILIGTIPASEAKEL